MRSRLLASAAIATIAATVLAGCGGSSASAPAENCTPAHPGLKTIQEGTLAVAQYAYPPFSYYENGKLTGVEGDVLTAIAEMECLTIKVISGEAAAMITNVQTGRADTTLGSWYRTKARAEIVNLSQPVVTSPLSFVSATGVNTVDGMKELTVGAVTGLVGLDALQALLGDKLKTYADNASLASDIKAGRIEGFVQGLGAAIATIDQFKLEGFVAQPIQADPRLPVTLSVGQTNFPTNKNNPDLSRAIDEDINQIRSSGKLAEIAKKYGYPVEATEPGEPNLL